VALVKANEINGQHAKSDRFNVRDGFLASLSVRHNAREIDDVSYPAPVILLLKLDPIV
jgi:hypothetical protein